MFGIKTGSLPRAYTYEQAVNVYNRSLQPRTDKQRATLRSPTERFLDDARKHHFAIDMHNGIVSFRLYDTKLVTWHDENTVFVAPHSSQSSDRFRECFLPWQSDLRYKDCVHTDVFINGRLYSDKAVLPTSTSNNIKLSRADQRCRVVGSSWLNGSGEEERFEPLVSFHNEPVMNPFVVKHANAVMRKVTPLVQTLYTLWFGDHEAITTPQQWGNIQGSIATGTPERHLLSWILDKRPDDELMQVLIESIKPTAYGTKRQCTFMLERSKTALVHNEKFAAFVFREVHGDNAPDATPELWQASTSLPFFYKAPIARVKTLEQYLTLLRQAEQHKRHGVPVVEGMFPR